jgi:hypothetical protein
MNQTKYDGKLIRADLHRLRHGDYQSQKIIGFPRRSRCIKGPLWYVGFLRIYGRNQMQESVADKYVSS